MKLVLQDIVGEVSKAIRLPLPEAQVVVRCLLSTLEQGLKDGHRIEIRDFGVFQTKTVSGKKGRDLSRNLAITLPAYRKISFKAGKNLKKVFWDLPQDPKRLPVQGQGQLEMFPKAVNE
jgi:nucleoid DNA-binding protein